jgi:hypothetical protein
VKTTLLEFFGIKKRVVVRTKLVPAQLPPDIQFVVDALARPEKWQPMEPLTEADIAELKALLRSPLMQKLDVCMYNMAQQQMRTAAFAPTAEVLTEAKFAAGFKASWERFKSLSVLTLTKTGESETTEDTGAEGLEQYIP